MLSEVLPLLDACRYLEREAGALLKPELRRSGRPAWWIGHSLRVKRVPRGVVLIVAPSNYKLMLAGIQALQALAAGNAVAVKPGRGGTSATLAMKRRLAEAGLPRGLFQVLDEATAQAHQAMDGGVDHVVFTGTNAAGRAVAQTAADNTIPTIMELSGCDAAFIRRDAEVALATEGLSYGLRFNGGDTCMSPRRVFVDEAIADLFIHALTERMSVLPAVSMSREQVDHGQRLIDEALRVGGRLLTDRPSGLSWRPVVIDCGGHSPALLNEPTSLPVLTLRRFNDEREAIREVNACPYELAASIFSGSRQGAGTVAAQLKAGTILINDLIVPTADPRLPFEAGGRSGYGVTRGSEGLLAMTRVQAVGRTRGRHRPYWRPLSDAASDRAAGVIAMLHGGGGIARLRALKRIVLRHYHSESSSDEG